LDIPTRFDRHLFVWRIHGKADSIGVQWPSRPKNSLRFSGPKRGNGKFWLSQSRNVT